jgi:hypothetical protein
MAGMYDKFKQDMIEAGLSLTSGSTLKCILIDDADYTPNYNTHDFYNDVAAAARVGTLTALASKTATDGVFDAADTVIATVTGDQSESVLLVNDTGTESTSRLVALEALASAVTPNGGDITVAWDNGTNKIFKLT